MCLFIWNGPGEDVETGYWGDEYSWASWIPVPLIQKYRIETNGLVNPKIPNGMSELGMKGNLWPLSLRYNSFLSCSKIDQI